MPKTPKAKSLIANGIFAFFGVSGWICVVTDSVYSLPLALFYATLVLNTFFSVALFSKITPSSDHLQNLIDLALVCFYAMLAFSFGSIVLFTLVSVFLFIVASAKYAFLLNQTWHPKLFKRKVLVDILGTFASALALTLALFWNETLAAWFLAVGFVIANILLFFVWPLYREDGNK